MRARLAPSLTAFIIAAKKGHFDEATRRFHDTHIPHRTSQHSIPQVPGWVHSHFDDNLGLPSKEAAKLARSIMSIRSQEQHLNFHTFERHANVERSQFLELEERPVIRDGKAALAQLQREIRQLALGLDPETLLPILEIAQATPLSFEVSVENALASAL